MERTDRQISVSFGFHFRALVALCTNVDDSRDNVARDNVDVECWAKAVPACLLVFA